MDLPVHGVQPHRPRFAALQLHLSWKVQLLHTCLRHEKLSAPHGNPLLLPTPLTVGTSLLGLSETWHPLVSTRCHGVPLLLCSLELAPVQHGLFLETLNRMGTKTSCVLSSPESWCRVSGFTWRQFSVTLCWMSWCVVFIDLPRTCLFPPPHGAFLDFKVIHY